MTNLFNFTYQELLILAKIIDSSPQELVYHLPKLSLDQEITFQKQCELLQKGYPVDYILKRIKFLELDIIINSEILIPREETEDWLKFLINAFNNCSKKSNLEKDKLNSKQIFDLVKNLNKNRTRLIEIGCGSGVISLSLSRFFGEVLAVDISRSAILITKQNAKLNKIKNIQTQKVDAANYDMFSKFFLDEKINILIANLPYLPTSDKQKAISNKIDYEPYKALYSGFDGLKLYKKIVQNLCKLNQSSKPVLVWFELDVSNIKLAKNILSKVYPKTGIWYDSYKRARVLWGIL